MDSNHCFHCGDKISEKKTIVFDNKLFCCIGCKTVYEVFKQNDLISYYDFEKIPGNSPRETKGKFDFLNNENIVDKLLEFKEADTNIVSLYIPQIHCSSCIWILENLHKLQPGIISSQVNFNRKKVRISFNPKDTTLKNIVLTLCKIGYEPYISLEDYENKKSPTDRSLIYKIGVAFFCFGNIMLLSFPEYFEINDYWLKEYKDFFRWLIFALAIPTFVYSGSVYHKAAYHSIKARTFDINIPMSLGLIVMFIRSSYDIIFDHGPGFLDSLSSLIFFMLLGKLFQQKTYEFLSFERDYKSYFPIAVTKINPDKTECSLPIYDIKKGDRLLVRNQELIPVDGILLSDSTHIDYSFVTGEANPIRKVSGNKIFAGGKQLEHYIEMEVTNTVSQSYLTQLWDNQIFDKKVNKNYTTLITKVSHYFTPVLLSISLIGFLYWFTIDVNTAFNVFTAVLIIACPCALALSTPFTLGNVIRIFGKHKFYLKNAAVIEQMSKVDTIVFDKTGTITTNKTSKINYEGSKITKEELNAIKNLAHASNHPLSRKLYNYLSNFRKEDITNYKEDIGEGIQGVINGKLYKIGSAKYLNIKTTDKLQTNVYISIQNKVKGKFIFENQYREGLVKLFKDLNKKYDLVILSGDNQGEQKYLEDILPASTQMVFNQKPQDKLEYIEMLQLEGKNVMMIGDGLNDSGALAQSNVGISISEDVNIFSPACDGIIDASKFEEINTFLKLSKRAISIIKISFLLSILYNIVGISVALSGNLSPLFAAILMPISTATIIGFVTLASNICSKRTLSKIE